jgi:hypothetical protein
MLIYKSNRDGSVQAAYSSKVHVGYVQCSSAKRWIWWLHLVQPAGNYVTGIEENETIAKTQLNTAFENWLEAAGLYRF